MRNRTHVLHLSLDRHCATPGQGTIVYFVRSGPLVKIGRTTWIDCRMRAIRRSLPHPKDSELIAYFHGSKQDERRLHRAFKHIWVGKEWYRLGFAIQAFIGVGCCRVKEKL